jgi:outer membrane protein insertion porin family
MPGLAPGQVPFDPTFTGQNPPLMGPPDGVVDLDEYLSETQTGRFMVGAGINSNAGLVGSIVVDEQNFDILRWPDSIEDFRDGTAFRGRGERLRIEAAPGTQVSRYMFNFLEPYLLDTPVSFGVSGYYFERIYTDWTEKRLGGRVSWGYQFTPDLSGNVALRAETINISNPAVPTPPELAQVVGNNSLFSVRGQLAHDTRDNTFLATEGHYIELAFEEAFGSYTFPRSTLDLRRYFLLYERADGSGRQVLSLLGHLGFSGADTPVYERFFAGGFGTLRGFAFRGAKPRSVPRPPAKNRS